MENNQRWFLGQAVCELFHKDGYLNLWQGKFKYQRLLKQRQVGRAAPRAPRMLLWHPLLV